MSTDYYAYATGGGFPIIKSSDLVHREQVGRAFSVRPSWVVQSGTGTHGRRASFGRPGRALASDVARLLLHALRRPQRPAHSGHALPFWVAWSLTASGPFTDLGPIQAEDGSNGPRRAPARRRRGERLQQHRPGAVRGRRRLCLPVHVNRSSLPFSSSQARVRTSQSSRRWRWRVRPPRRVSDRKASIRCDSRQLGAGTRPRRHGGEPMR